VNEHQIKRANAAERRLKWIRAVERGEVKIIDRFMNEVTAGSHVLLHPAVDILMDVVSVQPNLRSDQPEGYFTVTLSVTMPVQVPCNLPWVQAILMATSDQPAPSSPPPGPGPLRATRQDGEDEPDEHDDPDEVMIGGHLASVDVDNPQEG
jgi:hypothetical protein